MNIYAETIHLWISKGSCRDHHLHDHYVLILILRSKTMYHHVLHEAKTKITELKTIVTLLVWSRRMNNPLPRFAIFLQQHFGRGPIVRIELECRDMCRTS